MDQSNWKSDAREGGALMRSVNYFCATKLYNNTIADKRDSFIGFFSVLILDLTIIEHHSSDIKSSGDRDE